MSKDTSEQLSLETDLEILIEHINYFLDKWDMTDKDLMGLLKLESEK